MRTCTSNGGAASQRGGDHESTRVGDEGRDGTGTGDEFDDFVRVALLLLLHNRHAHGYT
jgi:hypothetical protein